MERPNLMIYIPFLKFHWSKSLWTRLPLFNLGQNENHYHIYIRVVGQKYYSNGLFPLLLYVTSKLTSFQALG